MKKVILIILVLSLALSCNTEKPEKATPEKPFIIVFKFVNSAKCNRCSGPEKSCTRYEYIDKNCNTFEFCDYADVYNIGDTIK